MGKKKSCDVSTRGVIIKLSKEKKTYREIADLLKCSKRMVFNAVSHFKTHGSIENVPRKLRPRKTSSRTDNRIVKLAKVNPHMSAVEIYKEIFDENSAPSSKIAVRTVRKRLQDAGLHGRIARKKPLLSKKHLKLGSNLLKNMENGRLTNGGMCSLAMKPRLIELVRMVKRMYGAL